MQFLFVALFLVFSCEAHSSSELIYEAQKKGINLTDKDKAILETGEISTARYVTGGILGTYPLGFGIGHAIQGRWSEDGKVFTFGELGTLGVAVGAALSCMGSGSNDEWECSSAEEALIVVGVLGFVGIRVWEIVDVWAVPPFHNTKFNKLKKYIDESKQTKASLDLVPVFSPRMGQGVGLKYTF